MSHHTWDSQVGHLRKVLAAGPDRRTGDNTPYSMEDLGLSAFSVFFTQSPSFLTYQKTMPQAQGQSNAPSLFQIEQIPSDNPLRPMLDPIPPEQLFPLYDHVFQALRDPHPPG